MKNAMPAPASRKAAPPRLWAKRESARVTVFGQWSGRRGRCHAEQDLDHRPKGAVQRPGSKRRCRRGTLSARPAIPAAPPFSPGRSRIARPGQNSPARRRSPYARSPRPRCLGQPAHDALRSIMTVSCTVPLLTAVPFADRTASSGKLCSGGSLPACDRFGPITTAIRGFREGLIAIRRAAFPVRAHVTKGAIFHGIMPPCETKGKSS